MATLKLFLRLAATALALMCVGLALLGFWRHFPPFDWEAWATVLVLVGGLTSALMFLVAGALETMPPDRHTDGAS